MKHYSPASAERIEPPRLGQHLTDAELAEELLARARQRRIAGELLTEREVAAELARRLDGRRGAQGRLAGDLGISQGLLSQVLAGDAPVSDALARKVGLRRVVRFERVGDPDGPRSTLDES